MNFLLFASVFLLVMALLNIYIWRRFLRLLTHGIGRYLIVVPIVLMLGDIFFVVDIVTGIIPDSPALYMISSAFVGITFMLFVVAVVYDLTITVSRRVPFDQAKRRTLKIIFDVTMLVMAVSYLLRGLSQGVRPPGINQVRVRIKDFPLDNFTIVQLTDIHVGRTIKRGFIEELVSRTNQLQPDMVVITGDLVDLPVPRIEYDLYPLRDLKAPAYFILGNHEYFHGPGETLSYVKSLGIRPLVNECIQIGEGAKRFNLVGIADLIGERTGLFPPDLDRAFAGMDPQCPCIVLAHQPKTILRVDNHRCDLMLSGHTHGGQIFPFGFLVMMDQPYLYGLHRHGADRQIFVSRGTGYWGPPLRVLAPSEISRIVIQRS